MTDDVKQENVQPEGEQAEDKNETTPASEEIPAAEGQGLKLEELPTDGCYRCGGGEAVNQCPVCTGGAVIPAPAEAANNPLRFTEGPAGYKLVNAAAAPLPAVSESGYQLWGVHLTWSDGAEKVVTRGEIWDRLPAVAALSGAINAVDLLHVVDESRLKETGERYPAKLMKAMEVELRRLQAAAQKRRI